MSGAAIDRSSRRRELVTAFRRFLPHASVLHTEEALKPYECDGLTAYRQVPLVAVLPETVEQVQEVMRTCADVDVPVVARGAGTGLSGGALPLADGVLLSLAKFNRILEVDTVNRTARVQPGVRNLAISEHVAPFGLYYAPDPSSQIACSIGGNVAENAGGLHCLKYGLTVHNILELTVITAGAERITIGGGALDAPGYDLLALMTGSEGLLGVVVEVKVKLLPKPACAKVLLAAFVDVESAGAAVGAIIAEGILPAGLEMMDNFAIRATDDFCGAGYPTDAAAILLCELDGIEAEVEDQIAGVRAVLAACGATEVRVARDEAERVRFWAGRKAAFPAAGRLSPDYLCMDGTIPRRELPAVLNRMQALSEESGLRIMNVFHAGDGNLHPLILYDANAPGELELAERVGAADPGALRRGRWDDHRRAWGRGGEDRPDVRAVRIPRAGAVPVRQGRVRSERNAQSRQGGADPAALRRVWRHARARRQAAVRRDRAVLNRWIRTGRSACATGASPPPLTGSLSPSPAAEPRSSWGASRKRSASTSPATRASSPTNRPSSCSSARGGTPLAEVTAALEERGQMLAFEPPSFGAEATIGGTIAAGLSGPARPYGGCGTRLRARHPGAERQGRGAALRRRGDEERRRLRRVAPDDRGLRDAGGAARRVAQGAAASGRLAHPRVRRDRGGGDRAM